MKILITGGFGYLGGRLGQWLHHQGHCIYLGTRHPPSAPPAWLPQAIAIETAWGSDEQMQNACRGIDVIIHAAGMNAHDCAADPVEALKFNGVCTTRLLQAAITQHVKRFIYLSTAHVYGSPLTGTICETTCPMNLHPYATSHRAGEDAVLNASQRNAIEGIVVRLSNAYGRPAHEKADCWALLVNDLCYQAVTKRAMFLHSSGTQQRDFIPISDVCRAIHALIYVAKDRLIKNIVNIGGQWTLTVWEMACLIQERCQHVLGFRPELTRAISEEKHEDVHLEYRIDVLSNIGFKSEIDRHTEIDQLLYFARSHFAVI